MNRRFSIGEVSKLHHISVQTLRHYDKIGLLKPSYVNEQSGYRYYCVKHFIALDFIKQCKAMGLTLEEIKVLMDEYTSVESILNVITRQKEMVDAQIANLQNIKEHISIVESKIQSALNEGLDKVFVKHCNERSFLKYNNTKRYTEEFEIKLAKALGEIEKKYGGVHKGLAFAVPYEKFEPGKPITYDHMMIACASTCFIGDKEQVILPEGEYITINFDHDYQDTSLYYNKLVAYIKKHELKVGDTFYESYIMTRIGTEEGGKALGQIQIQLLR